MESAIKRTFPFFYTLSNSKITDFGSAKVYEFVVLRVKVIVKSGFTLYISINYGTGLKDKFTDHFVTS